MSQRPLYSIYLILSGMGLVKLGYSKNVEQRVKAIQSHSASWCYPLLAIGSWSRREAWSLEQYLHGVYHAYRVKNEWFDLRPRDIREIMRVFAVPLSVRGAVEETMLVSGFAFLPPKDPMTQVFLGWREEHLIAGVLPSNVPGRALQQLFDVDRTDSGGYRTLRRFPPPAPASTEKFE